MLDAADLELTLARAIELFFGELDVRGERPLQCGDRVTFFTERIAYHHQSSLSPAARDFTSITGSSSTGFHSHQQRVHANVPGFCMSFAITMQEQRGQRRGFSAIHGLCRRVARAVITRDNAWPRLLHGRSQQDGKTLTETRPRSLAIPEAVRAL